MTQKFFFIVFFTMALFLLLIFASGGTAKTNAAGTVPFGGRINAVFYCCNGITIAVGPPRGGIFLFTYDSILHAYYNIYAPGPWVLGLASPGGFCEVPPLCIPVAVDNTIIRVGTSGL